MDLLNRFDRIFIHRDSEQSALSLRLQSLFPREKIETVSSRPLPQIRGELSPEEFAQSKRLLYVCKFPGQFFKRCPGSRPGLACCNYFVLNWGLQCDMNCSYCYLQSFINTPLLTIYSNINDAMDELRTMHAQTAQQSVRVGTGETVDSLSLDPLTLYSRKLIELFREFPKWSLEFKTKSAAVDQFLDVPHIGNITTSWSINPQLIIEREEHGTASLPERLEAARKCRQAGHKLALHMDPMIWHPEWKESYSELVETIIAEFSPEDIPYMSVGALRFQPEQRAMMRERFGMKSYVTRAEVFPSQDGKWRYDQNLRQQMFEFVLKEFRAHSPKWRLFMCMETPETWLKTTGASPFQDNSLNDLFDPKVLHSVRSAASNIYPKVHQDS
jgi:spore photoproduct lyase